MSKKICTKCKKDKKFEEFSKLKLGKFGLGAHCKECRSKYDQTHRNKFLKYHKKKRLNELEKFKSYDKKYKSENRDKQNLYNKNKWKNNIQYRLRKLLRGRFYAALSKGYKITSALKLLGCTVEEFKQYLEKQFKPEMNWGNWGKVWEMDHIKPCALFNLKDPKHQQECFHYSNLQPLFKTTEIARSFGYINEIGNRDKGDK